MQRYIKLFAVMSAFIAFTLTASAQEPLSLEQAIKNSLDNNYNIVMTEMRVEIAGLNNNWANAGAIPKIDLTGSGSLNGNFTDGHDQTIAQGKGGVGLNWLLFDGRGMAIRKENLEYYEEQSQGNLAVLVETTIQNTISLYYRALLQEEMLEMYAYIRDLSKDRYEYAERQKEVGTSGTYNLLQAQNAYLQDESNYLNQLASFHDAMRNLNYVMAVPSENVYQLTEEFKVETPEYTFATLKDKMISNNTNLKNQYISQKLLNNEIQAARSAYFPTLSLGTGYQASWTSTKNDDFPAEVVAGHGYYGNLNLSFSLFDGGIKKRTLQIAKIQEEIGAIEIKDMKHSLDIQLASLYEYYNVRKQILNVSNEALKAAQLNLDLSEQKFKNGTINSFNYRDVQQMYLSAAISQLNAVFNLIDSKTQLAKITGGIISEYE
jgi:outer membrane protein TolC